MPDEITKFLIQFFHQNPVSQTTLVFYSPLGTSQYMLGIGVPSSVADWESYEEMFTYFRDFEGGDHLLQSGLSPLPAQAVPFALIEGAVVTRLYGLEHPYNPKKYYVEDWGNPFGVISETVEMTQWREFRAQSEKDYLSVPRSAIQAYGEIAKRHWDEDTILIHHAFYRLPEDSLW